MSGVLVVTAHPDDEAVGFGGLMAWSAALGHRVALLCLTRGEHGQRRAALADDPRPLSEIRAEELEAAATCLGVADLTLLRHEDGMLPHLPPARLEADIRDALDRLQPDVVVTFDADGLYWHPDHVAVHERVTAAVGRTAHAALLYGSLARSMVPALVRAVREAVAAGQTAPPAAWDVLGVADPDAFGAAAPAPTLELDVGAHAITKLRALRCHRSQAADGLFDRLDETLAPRLLGHEQYRRAPVGSPVSTFVDALAS